MLRCTYIVLLYNNESNITSLVNSLKYLNGNFRKEFIFVDDGSSDNTLAELKKATVSLPRTTIITQEHQGFSSCINKGLKIAYCDYVHFVSGHEILHPDSTALLLEACAECDAEVALGAVAHDKEVEGNIKATFRCLEKPIAEILAGRVAALREVGGAGSLVSKGLLDKIEYADTDIYSHSMSLSLRCGMHSRFGLIPECITYMPEITVTSDKKFESYNNLRAIYNFIKDNQKVAKKNIAVLMKALSANSLEQTSKIKYTALSVLSKYSKTVTYKQVLASYKKEYEKLF